MVQPVRISKRHYSRARSTKTRIETAWDQTGLERIKYSRARSTKTRIETSVYTVSTSERFSRIREQDPLKQGLKQS